jgi:hypothetical protein
MRGLSTADMKFSKTQDNSAASKRGGHQRKRDDLEREYSFRKDSLVTDEESVSSVTNSLDTNLVEEE